MFGAEPKLEVLPKPDYWALHEALQWRSSELELTIPEGFVTDLASIPRLMRNVLDVCGRSREPAILHDWLYCCQRTSRAFADRMLRAALVAYGAGRVTALIYWAGVRLGGWVEWSRRLARGGGLQVDDFVSTAAFQAALSSLHIQEIQP